VITEQLIRPLTTTQMIDLPFMLMRQLGARLVRVHLVGVAPLLVVAAWLLLPLLDRVREGDTMFAVLANPDLADALGLWRLIALAAVLSLAVFAAGAGTWMCAWHILGEAVGTRAAFARTWRTSLRVWPVTFVGVAIYVCTTLATVTFWCGGPLLFIGLQFLNFLMHAAVLEDRGTLAAIRRSARLQASAFLRNVWHALLNGLMFLVGCSVPAMLCGFGFQFVIQASMETQSVLVAAVALLLSPLVMGLLPCASTLAYYEARARSEGLDLQIELLTQPHLIRRTLVPGSRP
jgi:hypothetical protein